ncbi:chitinase-3-like protein 1 [Ornithodoros turicata]|uniref:chitinase-3-like protein 1 n=1 Tax=Ornithodoros turicata TaxID=34597 RepID=UPI0031399ED6
MEAEEANNAGEDEVGVLGVEDVIQPVPSDVLLSVACLLSVLLTLFGLAAALQTHLVRKLQLGISTSLVEVPVKTSESRSAPQIPSHPHSSRSVQELPIAFQIYPKEVYRGSSRIFCVFNDGVDRVGRSNVAFTIETFPYHLCTDALYCCCGIDARSLTLVPRSSAATVLKFHAIKLRNPSIRIWVTAGGASEANQAFSRIVTDAEAKRLFVRQAVDWLLYFGYDGLNIQWSFPDLEHRESLTALMQSLKTACGLTRKLLALAVPVDETKRRGFDVEALAEILDGNSILMMQSTPLEHLYNQTFFIHTQEEVEKYARIAQAINSTTSKVCYVVSIAEPSLFLTNRSRWNIGDEAKGPWRSNLSSTAGVSAFDDVCKQHWIVSKRMQYGVYSRKGDRWAGYLTRDTMREFLMDITNVTGVRRCLGVADPEWDDFSGVCDTRSPYPLTRVVFAVATGIEKAPRPPDEDDI